MPRISIWCSCTTRAPRPAETDAAKPVDNQVFFIRFAQRAMHLLTMHSAAGRLYEVDVRLRPSGKGGMLITRIGAFAEYQEKEAWTWEHQALLHARAVAGDAALRAEFERVRLEVLQRCVRRDTLRERSARHARAHAPRAVARQARLGPVRHEAGSRRHRRHRIPGAVLGAAARRHASAGGHVRRHHPPAGIGGLGRPGAAGHRGRADRRLPQVPRALAPPVAGKGRTGGAGRGIRGRRAPRSPPSGTPPWWT